MEMLRQYVNGERKQIIYSQKIANYCFKLGGETYYDIPFLNQVYKKPSMNKQVAYSKCFTFLNDYVKYLNSTGYWSCKISAWGVISSNTNFFTFAGIISCFDENYVKRLYYKALIITPTDKFEILL